MKSQKSSKVRKLFLKKNVLDLCTENLFFYVIGLTFIIQAGFKNEMPPLVTIVSTFLSLISCTVVLSKLYFKRIKRAHKYKETNFKEYLQFPLELQLFLANPSKLDIYKFFEKETK